MSSDARCPVCEHAMLACGRSYPVDELFELWKPVAFSAETIEAHRRQAPATQLFRCSACGLEMYLPAIVGTPQFYVEAYNLEHTQTDSTFTYSDDKWEFEVALQDAARCRRVFEFGCGNGSFLERAAGRGAEVAGSEYNSGAVAHARARTEHHRI